MNTFYGYSVGDSIAAFKGNSRPLTGGTVTKITATQITVTWPSGTKKRFSQRGREIGGYSSWSYSWYIEPKADLEKRLRTVELAWDQRQFASSAAGRLEYLTAASRNATTPERRKEILDGLSELLIALTESDAQLRVVEVATNTPDL